MHRLLLLAPALLAGCAISPTPNYDARFGDAVRQARQAHILNPQAAPIAQGIDGVASKNATDRYQSTFAKPPPTVNVINIGGSIAGGGGGAP